MSAQALTCDPFHLFATRVYLAPQLAVHVVETLDCIRYAVAHFEMVTESPINHETCCKLQTNRVSGQRGATEQKEIPTLRVANTACLHELPIDFDFAHSLKSGVGNDEWTVVCTLLSGMGRHGSWNVGCRQYKGIKSYGKMIGVRKAPQSNETGHIQ